MAANVVNNNNNSSNVAHSHSHVNDEDVENAAAMLPDISYPQANFNKLPNAVHVSAETLTFNNNNNNNNKDEKDKDKAVVNFFTNKYNSTSDNDEPKKEEEASLDFNCAGPPTAPPLPRRMRSSFAVVLDNISKVSKEIQGIKNAAGPLLICILVMCATSFASSVGAIIATRDAKSHNGKMVDANNPSKVLATSSAEFAHDATPNSAYGDEFFQDLTAISLALDDNETTAFLRVHGFVREPCERCHAPTRVVLLTAEAPVFVEDTRITHGPLATLTSLGQHTPSPPPPPAAAGEQRRALMGHDTSNLSTGSKVLCDLYGYYCGRGVLGGAFRYGVAKKARFSFRYSWYNGYRWWSDMRM